MRSESYSQTELEQAAEEILAELEGWGHRDRKAAYQREAAEAEPLVRLLMTAAEQAVIRLQTEKETEVPAFRYDRDGAEAGTEAASHSDFSAERMESGLSLRQQREAGQVISAADAAIPAAQPVSFGAEQLRMETISEWIERDSRRYDSEFTIF